MGKHTVSGVPLIGPFEPTVSPRFRRHHRRRRHVGPVPALSPARTGNAGARVRGRHRCRRHLVLEPLSGRAVRFRELLLRLLVLEANCWRNGTGRSISRASRKRCAISTTSPTSSTCAATSSFAAASRRRLTRRIRGAGPSRWRTAAASARRFLITAIGPLSTPTLPRIEGRDSFEGAVLPHRAMAARAGRLHRQARRRDRHRRHRRADHPDHRRDGRPSHGVPAHAELVRAAAQRQDRRRDAEEDQGRLSRDVRPVPGNVRLLPAYAGPARRLRGLRRGARGVLRKALWRARLRHLAGQFPRHPDRPQGERDDQRFRGAQNPPAGEEPGTSRKS